MINKINLEKSSNFKKYQTKNPLKAYLIGKYIKTVLKLIENLNAKNILKIGCGEGFLTKHLVKTFPKSKIIGIDISEKALKIARKLNPEVIFLEKDATQLKTINKNKDFDLIICCETLEHISNTKAVVNEICRLGSSNVLLAVPNEPFFRISNLIALNHLLTLGNPPEHINHWSANSFSKFVNSYFDIKNSKNPFPWTIILGKIPKNN